MALKNGVITVSWEDPNENKPEFVARQQRHYIVQ